MEYKTRKCVVFLSDFGTVDGAVSAMHGVADGVDETLRLEDLTHEIPQFNIWEASYRLIQALSFWKPGTVFVCVVDPGVGSDRKSVVALTKSGHYIVTPDNGTLTHVANEIGLIAVREIEEAVNRLHDSQKSYTFHGRDVYAYTAARLAAGIIDFEGVGRELKVEDVVRLEVQKPEIIGCEIVGSVDILDVRYGSLWTNIPQEMLEKLDIHYGDVLDVQVNNKGCIVFGYPLRFCKNFTEVPLGEPLLYINSLLNVGIALNQGSFSTRHHIKTGEGWRIKIKKHNDKEN